MEDVSQSRRRRDRQLSFHSDTVYNTLSDGITDDALNNRRFSIYRFVPVLRGSLNLLVSMHKSTRTGLIGLVLLLFFVVVILLLNLGSLKSDPSPPGTCVSLDGRLTCYATDPDPYRNYGSKTAYHVVLEDNKESIGLKGCTAKVFYMLSRHATRYPDIEYIEYINKYLPDLKERIIKSYENGKVKLCKEDIDNLKSWTPTMNSTDENMLSETGRLEAEELGERLRKRFDTILGMTYSPDRFVIEYTSRNRTKHTAENFARGLFTEKDYERIEFKDNENDKVLQFHKDCKIIKKICKDVNYDTKEAEEFKNGLLMKKVVSSVSKRIGFNVSYDDVHHMYVACTFGYALNISDAWCAMFSTDDMKVFEFKSDIDDYYKDAYGNEVNYKQACPVVKDIVDRFKSYENTKMRKVILHFSHAGAIKKVYAAFGLFRDNHPLTADNFCALNSRKWRTSQIAPFNSNIVFVLYDCSGELKLITLHNEKPVIVDGCDNELCSLQKFYKQYLSVAETCNLTEICDTCTKK